MTEVNTKITANHELLKYSSTQGGMNRLKKELLIYQHLGDNEFIPALLSSNFDQDSASLTLEYIEGQSLKERLSLSDNYTAEPQDWADISERLGQYVEAEMSFIESGVLYRDLNLEHMIFTDNSVKIVDLEASIIQSQDDKFHLSNTRGTWETMAPEEFCGYGDLTTQTASYRVAVICHLALYGSLPFARSKYSRSKAHKIKANKPLQLSPEMPVGAKKIFTSALSKQPAQRHKNPGQFLIRLGEILN